MLLPIPKAPVGREDALGIFDADTTGVIIVGFLSSAASTVLARVMPVLAVAAVVPVEAPARVSTKAAVSSASANNISLSPTTKAGE